MEHVTRDSTRLFAVEIPHTTVKELLKFIALDLAIECFENS